MVFLSATWSAWTKWTDTSDCSKICGTKNQQRTRTCSHANACLGRTNDTRLFTCGGNMCRGKQYARCYNKMCIVYYIYIYIYKFLFHIVYYPYSLEDGGCCSKDVTIRCDHLEDHNGSPDRGCDGDWCCPLTKGRCKPCPGTISIS